MVKIELSCAEGALGDLLTFHATTSWPSSIDGLQDLDNGSTMASSPSSLYSNPVLFKRNSRRNPTAAARHSVQ